MTSVPIYVSLRLLCFDKHTLANLSQMLFTGYNKSKHEYYSPLFDFAFRNCKKQSISFQCSQIVSVETIE